MCLLLPSGGAQARASTKPSPPNRMPVPKLYVRDMWRFREVELNCKEGRRYQSRGVRASRPQACRMPRDVTRLCEHVHLADAAVDAVAHRHVNEAVSAPDGHCRLRSLLGERIQARARSAAQDDSCDALGVDLLALFVLYARLTARQQRAGTQPPQSALSVEKVAPTRTVAAAGAATTCCATTVTATDVRCRQEVRELARRRLRKTDTLG